MGSARSERIKTASGTIQTILICALVLGCASSGTCTAPVGAEGLQGATEVQQEGRLQIYPRSSSIGTVAKRTFYDSAGRPAKTIHYGLDHEKAREKNAVQGPYTEDMLVVYSIEVSTYDTDGREIRVDHYGPDLRLSRILEIIYDESESIKRRVWLTPERRRYYEIRYRDKREVSHLYFDDTGEGLIAVRGEIPHAMDLVHGWGPSAEGLSCGIASDRPRARSEDIQIYVTVRNLTDTEIRLAEAIQYRIIQMDLRDAAGGIVPQDTEYVNKRTERLLEMNRGPREGSHAIAPSEAYTLATYPLTDWYRGLKPGKYSLTVHRRGLGQEFTLTSNTIELELPSD